MHIRRLLPLCMTLALAGCLGNRPVNPAPSDYVRTRSAAVGAPANLEASTRVDSIGRTILAANPGIGAKPLFQTIGVAHPEIFHNRTQFIYITQGMVERCPQEDELAAVLCYELGRMVAEREAIAPLAARQREILKPIDPGLSKDVVGAETAPDQFRLAELARYEKEKAAQPATPPLPDPWNLARLYLKKAGFDPDALSRIKPLLDEAIGHYEIERQIMGSAMPAPFRPAR